MAGLTLQGNASGTGSLTVEGPNTNSTYTQTLAAVAGTLAPIVSGTAVASTSGTNIDFGNIPAWAKRITVMFNGVSTSGTSAFLFQIGSGSIAATGYQSNGMILQSGATPGGASSTSGFVSSNATGASDFYGGSVVISLLGSNIWVCNGQLLRYSTTYQSLLFVGQCTLSGALDRIRVTTVGGTDTFDAGTINIMWE